MHKEIILWASSVTEDTGTKDAFLIVFRDAHFVLFPKSGEKCFSFILGHNWKLNFLMV